MSPSSSEIKLPSNRSFGLLFVGVFALIGLWPLVHAHAIRWWALGLAAVLLGIALLKADLLLPLNRLWMKFGDLLHKIVSPIMLGIIFFVVITPVALGMRLFGRDALRLKKNTSASVWITRADAPASLNRQF